jgi:hypothetical protein
MKTVQEPKTQEVPRITDGVDEALACSPGVQALAFRRIVTMRASVHWHDDGRVCVSTEAVRLRPDRHGRSGLTCIAKALTVAEAVSDCWRQWTDFMRDWV